MVNISTAWTKNLPPEKKKDFEAVLRNDTTVLGRLKEILLEMEQELLKQSRTVEDFKDPNWSHKQAFRNGDLSRLAKIKELLP